MKTVLITGASSGIGRETALVFAQNNFNLVLAARRKDNLIEIKNEIEKKYAVKAEIIDMDLSRTSSAEALFQAVSDKKLQVDILINNAGYGLSGQFTEIDMQKEEEMLVLNMITLTKLTKLFAKDMLIKNGGTIINLASTASFQPVPTMACYGATKSYVLNFTEAVAYEMRKTNVKLFAICPGATQSEFSKVAGVESAKMFKSVPTSADLAQFIYQSLGTKKYYRIHGFKNRFLKSASVLFPHKWVIAITAGMME
jgi:uncharacterized protein